MKFFQKRWVAWTLCLLVIFASTLLNTRWKLGAKCIDMSWSFYSENGIAPSLNQLGEDGVSLAKIAEANGIDAGALRVASDAVLNKLGSHSLSADALYASYRTLCSELDSVEQKLLGTGLSAEDAAAVSASLERIHTAKAQIGASDYNTQVQRFLDRYNNGFTRALANLAGVKLPSTFA